MIKFALLLLTLSFCLYPAYSESRYITVPQNPYEYVMPTQFEINRLSEIENQLYGQNFTDQNIISRIERLEMDVFHRTYPNSSPDQRINNIIYTYKRNSEIVKNQNTKKSKLKNIIDNVSSAFLGVPTGFTPPVYTDPYATPYYSIGSNGIGQHYGQYSDYYSSNGWHRQNHSYGTGSGVHIMD